ncbi:MAG: helix-turn-helix domain-containing protein [Chloroflexi bacterium]|nr:helix-turn-helix domain-containing protein [Chloroflexota bacterium]
MSELGQKQPTKEDIISAREAAEILGITQRHVTRLAESGEIVARKLGWQWAIIRQSVLEYKAKKEAQK